MKFSFSHFFLRFLKFLWKLAVEPKIIFLPYMSDFWFSKFWFLKKSLRFLKARYNTFSSFSTFFGYLEFVVILGYFYIRFQWDTVLFTIVLVCEISECWWLCFLKTITYFLAVTLSFWPDHCYIALCWYSTAAKGSFLFDAFLIWLFLAVLRRLYHWWCVYMASCFKLLISLV